jgi:flagellar biogenesis protein FliO
LADGNEPETVTRIQLSKPQITLKLCAVLAGLALSFSAMAGTGIAGTKLGGDYAPATSNGAGVGFGALAQMLLALAIVAFLLKWALPKLAGKVVGKKLVTSATGGIQVEETAQFAGGSLFIISARGKTLLVSVTGQSVTNLADLTKPEKPKVDPFEIALAEAQSRPTMTAAELEARAALDRLSQLTGTPIGH